MIDIRKTWRKVCVEAGCPNLLFHDLRRSAARNLRAAGVSETVIQKVGGWQTNAMFKRYAIVDSTDVSDALLKLQRHREVEMVNRAAEQGQEQEQEQPVSRRI